jgi:hypothetical protein
MPKKAATARRRAQHNKPKGQKSFELVRPEKVVTEEEEESSTIEAQESIVTEIEESSTTPTKESTANTKPVKPKTPAKVAVTTQEEPKTQERQNTPAPGSASARLAARRQAAQKQQQRPAATLITSEHFAYVRKDLIKIAIFAAFMFTAIIVLYLTLGRA